MLSLTQKKVLKKLSQDCFKAYCKNPKVWEEELPEDIKKRMSSKLIDAIKLHVYYNLEVEKDDNLSPTLLYTDLCAAAETGYFVPEDLENIYA